MGRSHMLHSTTTLVTYLLLPLLLILLLIFFTRPFLGYYYSSNFPEYNLEKKTTSSIYHVPEKNYCDLFSGDWVPSLEPLYYTNTTCTKIHDHQNCLRHGRPDTDFLRWRWKPKESGCVLPVFNPVLFLELMRGKSLAFVGDSLARNHMQSLLCMLSKVEDPIDVSEEKNEGAQFKRYEYKNHNFTIEIFWSPYLVKTTQTDPNDMAKPFNVYLDEVDENWTNRIDNFNYIIISAGQWFVRSSMFYINNQLIGCLWCDRKDITQLREDFGFQMAYKMALKAIYTTDNYKGVIFLRTFATSHFEHGSWTGDCTRTKPYEENETRLEDKSLNLYNVQIEEFKKAEKIGRVKGMKFRLMDVTRAMLRRPDGHPGRYYGKTNPKWANDCVHWCMPGPVDTWNEILLELLKREETKL